MKSLTDEPDGVASLMKSMRDCREAPSVTLSSTARTARSILAVIIYRNSSSFDEDENEDEDEDEG